MDQIIIIIVNALVTAGVVFGVVKTELKYLRRDVDLAHSRIDRLVKHP
jgi:hypothetical protein